VQILTENTDAKGLLAVSTQITTDYLVKARMQSTDDSTLRYAIQAISDNGAFAIPLYVEGGVNGTGAARYGNIYVISKENFTTGISVNMTHRQSTGIYSRVTGGVSGHYNYAIHADMDDTNSSGYALYAETASLADANSWAGYFTGSGGSSKVKINSTLVLEPVTGANIATAGAMYFDSDAAEPWFYGHDGTSWWKFSTSTASSLWTDAGN